MKKVAPVYCWLPNDTNPLLAGEFEMDGGQSRFAYDSSYLSQERSFALDPISLPLKKKKIIASSIFGVFSDASVDAWGKRVLERTYGELDNFDALVKSPNDGVGAIAIGDPDKKKSDLYSIDDLILASRKIRSMQSCDIPARILEVLDPVTSMGGMKPKVNLQHKGQLWLAKFGEKGDPIYQAHAESSMLQLGNIAGIDTCETEVAQVGEDCFAILIKRFDRNIIDRGCLRLAFASAHTILNVKPDSSMRDRSYIKLSSEIGRWSISNAAEQRRELWRRVVFNALVGNGDDHTKNHGLIRVNDWKLSPAFDIVPYRHKRTHLPLSMAFGIEDGSITSLVTIDNILSGCEKFGYDKEEAIETLRSMSRVVNEMWRDVMSENGMPDSAIDMYRHSFEFAMTCAESFSVVTDTPGLR